MNFPRLVLADERKNNLIPSSVILLAAMKRAGFPLRVFYCGINSLDICLLKNALEDEITIIHPKTCEKIKNIKILFELAADADKLNIVVCDLGKRGETYLECEKNFVAADVAAILNCPVIMCCYAESTPQPVAKIVSGFMEGLQTKNPNVRVDGIVFVNPFEQRSFQLVENSVCLTFHGLSFGYIPQELVPPAIKYEDICSVHLNQRSNFLIRAATTRISQMYNQIDYSAMEAIGKYYQKWTSVGGIEPIKRSKLPKIAVIDDIALFSEGNNSEILFRAFGCTVERVSLKNAFDRNFDIYYFPHGLGYAVLQNIQDDKVLIAQIKSAFILNKVIFASGASSQIFAEKVILSDGTEIPGLGIMPGIHKCSQDFGSPKTIPVLCESMNNGNLTQHKEKIGGYIIPWTGLSQSASKNKIAANWLCTPISGEGAAGVMGLDLEKSVFAGVVPDLWSNIDAARQFINANA